MADKYYTLKEFNKRISERLKPKRPVFSLAQRLRGLAGLRRPRLPRTK